MAQIERTAEAVWQGKSRSGGGKVRAGPRRDPRPGLYLAHAF